MTYRVELIHSKEGYSVACPDLPGCHSQGETQDEAIQNIKTAICDYLAVDKAQAGPVPFREVRYVQLSAAGIARKPFEVTPIPMGLPPFVKADDLLDEFDGLCRR